MTILKNLLSQPSHPQPIAVEFWKDTDERPSIVYLVDNSCQLHRKIIAHKTFLWLSKGENYCVHLCRDVEGYENQP